MFIDIDTNHPHYERLKSVEKQVQSGARLTSHLLGYARKGKYEVKPLDLNHLVKDVSETFGRTKKEITIHKELSEDLLSTKADQVQIEQVLWNLFINAGDAMPGGGELILKTDNVTHENMKGRVYDPKPGKYVLLTVADIGIGMDKQTVDRIFDPFFTTKEMGRGTGLGLASAYGIIKAHAGYIDVESEKGHGTTFSIYLPSSEEEIQEVVKSGPEVVEGTETILLVDDEDVILEVGKELLEAMGYRVLTAGDGKEAIEIYEKNRDNIDLVILDMVMPQMGGGEAYDKMKEINHKIKVLLSSGYSIDSQAKKILARGCDAFIQKPFGMQKLSQMIREVLQKNSPS
jgi:CheY-like chemotaxis protein